MPALVLTSSNVQPSARATILWGIAGVTIAAGQPIYADDADLDDQQRGKFKLTDADAITPEAIKRGVVGLAANSAAIGQPVGCIVSDPEYTHGLAGVVKGDIVIAGATAGSLHLVSELATGWRPSVCLVCSSNTQAVLQITNGPVAK